MPFLALKLLLLTPTFAHAEYRAFELVITNPATGQERVEISTLGPQPVPRLLPD